MKKVVIHSNTLWSVSNFRYDLIRTLIQSGCQVICLASNDEISSSSYDRLRSIDAEIIEISMDRKGTNPLKDSVYLIRLIQIFKQIAPDVILNYTPKPNIYSSLACQFLGIPYINTINGLGSGFSSGFPVATIIRFLYKLALRKSKQVFVQNQDDLNFFLESKISRPDISSFIPGSGIDTDTFRNDEQRNPVPGALKFIYAGRLIKEKGVFDFIYLAEKLKGKYPKCKFWMVGFIDEGNPSSLTSIELDELTSSGIVEYKGKTDNIVEYLNASDIMIFPSIYREGMPRILLEAASCGMPIVTYDVPGCREVVTDGFNGYLCGPGNREHLIAVCERILNMQQSDIVKLGDNGRERATSNFTVEIVNNHYTSLLKEILEPVI